jgi:hypothetical protein
MKRRNVFVIYVFFIVLLSTIPLNKICTGDRPNVVALPDQSKGNSEVIKTKGTETIVADPPTVASWMAFTNLDFPNLPNNGYGIDQEGCWVSHQLDGSADPTDNIASVHWKRNVTTSVNMKKYRITSASLTCVVSANVSQNLECPGDLYDGFQLGDYIRFYVLISDLNGDNQHELAYNKTTYLGAGNDSQSYSFMNDTYLVPVSEDLLIDYLTSALETDYSQFTITLGIFIYCEQNIFDSEFDQIVEARIESLNLTFNYKKTGVMPNWLIWLLAGIIAGLIGFYISYMVYFRIPKVIRKIRKTEKNIRAGKETSPLDLNERESLIKDIQTAEMKLEERQLQQYEPLLNKIKKWFPKFKET